jgi:hypothetical protein
MKTVFNLEYSVVDVLGRSKTSTHVGVFGSLEELEVAKKKIIDENDKNVTFEVYPVEHIFSKS